MKTIDNQFDLSTSSTTTSTFLNTCLNNYGLKYLLLVILLVLYQFFGGIIFYFCESANDHKIEYLWKLTLNENRTRLISDILKRIPQNSTIDLNNVFLFF